MARFVLFSVRCFGALTSPITDLESTETMRKTSWRALLEGAPPRSA